LNTGDESGGHGSGNCNARGALCARRIWQSFRGRSLRSSDPQILRGQSRRATEPRGGASALQEFGRDVE
jgi:hypothetical protein